MTNKTLFFSAALAGYLLLVGTRTSHADAWRCVDQPGEDVCQDWLSNDIQYYAPRLWPLLNYTVQMQPIPWQCSVDLVGCRHCLSGEDDESAAAPSTIAVAAPAGAPAPPGLISGEIRWSINLYSELRSFIIGNHDAAATVRLSLLRASGAGMANAAWSDSSASYVFGESSAEVMAPEGPTGVVDLGATNHVVASGDLWNGRLRITVLPGERIWWCDIGYPNAEIRTANGIVDYPISWTPAQAIVADIVRDTFRRAVRLVVTGTP